MVDQTMGKTMGCGCHLGLSLSLNTGSSLVGLGRELSRGEKTRLRTDMKKKNDATAHISRVGNIGFSAGNDTDFTALVNLEIMCVNAIMRDH